MDTMESYKEISANMLKSNTSLVGIVCTDGVVLGADRRVTAGTLVVDKAYVKILAVNDRVLVAYTGGVADAQLINKIIAAEIRLKELKTKNRATIKETANLLSMMVYRGIRTPSMIPSITHFILSGYDEKGIYLFDISPDGYIQQYETCVATGSGIMQAHPILDTEYRKNITLDDGIALATKCIKAAIAREPSVGAGIDIYTVKKGEIKQVVDKEAVTSFETAK